MDGGGASSQLFCRDWGIRGSAIGVDGIVKVSTPDATLSADTENFEVSQNKRYPVSH